MYKFENYKKKREELLVKAEGLLDAGEVENAAKVREEITALDEQYEAAAKEAANIAALKNDNRMIADIGKGSVPLPNDASVADTTAAQDDEQDIYKNAFAKYLMNVKMNADEQSIFDKVNTDLNNALQTVDEHQVLIPETVREKIWTEIKDNHPIVNDLLSTNVKGDLTIIKEAQDIGDADWYDEVDEVGESDTKFSEVNLTGCEWAKAITISWKLKKMAMNDFLTYVATKIAEKMGASLAKAIVSGLGKPGPSDTFKAQPRGIITALAAEAGTPQIVEYANGGNPNYTNLLEANSKIKSGYFAGAVIYARNTDIWTKLANILDANKRPLFIPDVTQGGVGRLFGLVVKEEDAMAPGQILIANVGKGYVCNFNENISMHYEDHAKARKTDYMGYGIVDGDVLTTKAFALIRETVTP